MQKIIGKNLDLDVASHVVECTGQRRIQITVAMITGFPLAAPAADHRETQRAKDGLGQPKAGQGVGCREVRPAGAHPAR